MHKIHYDEEIAKEICFAISISTKPIHHLLKSNENWPSKDVFYRWMHENKSFQEMYALAKMRQQEILVDYQRDIVDEAYTYTYYDKSGSERIDPGAVQLAKLKCDNIKWEAARLAAHKYGTQINVNNLQSEEMQKANDKIQKLLEKHLKDA